MDCTGLQTKGVKALVDSGIDSVPEEFVLPQHQRPILSQVLSAHHEIPVIDMAELDGDKRFQTLTKIVQASREWGFFQVINHGVDPAVVENMKKSARSFHELPLEEKLKFVTDELDKSQYRPGTSHKTRNLGFGWMDQFIMYSESSNDWPSVCREAAFEYSKGVRRVAERLLCALSEGLGMHGDFLHKSLLMERQLLALNYYPRCPNPNLTLGIKSHSDPGTITIVLQDHVGGLQVFKGGRWIAVEPLFNAFVVNIGDQLEIVSNGRFTSVEHRAVTNAKEARLSLISAFTPGLDAKVGPILSELDGDRRMQNSYYRVCAFGVYLRNFLGKEFHSKSSLDFVRR